MISNFQDEQEARPSRGANPYKVSAALSGFLGLTTLVTFGFVSATCLPGLLPSVAWITAAAVIGAAGYGVLGLLSSKPTHFAIGVGLILALALGAALGGKELFVGWMMSLQFGAVSGGGVLLLFLLSGIVVGVWSLISGVRRD
jgi:hypothetical protein